MASYHGKKEKKPRAPLEDDRYKGFSKGEKDLYKEMNIIEKKEAKNKKEEEAKTAAFFAKKSYGRQMPVPTKKAENKDAFGHNSEDALIEWEKNQIKPLFREFDKDKKGISKESLVAIMKRLKQDECIIGKTPYCEESEFESLFA
mgnify:CR=1 FL=1|jgi:hypothetical protein